MTDDQHTARVLVDIHYVAAAYEACRHPGVYRGELCTRCGLFVGYPPDNAWLSVAQMAADWGTSERTVAGYVVKTGIDSTAHCRDGEHGREYSPQAQGLLSREWRSCGRPK